MTIIEQIAFAIGPVEILGAVAIGIGGADMLARRRARRAQTRGAEL